MRAWIIALLLVATPAYGDEPFDTDAAKTALSNVEYSDCGEGGPGRVRVTFASDGTVESATIVEGSFRVDVAQCVVKRFSAVTIKPFTGAAQSVGCLINLGGKPWAPPLPAREEPPVPYLGDPRDRPTPRGFHYEARNNNGSLATGLVFVGFGAAWSVAYFADADDLVGAVVLAHAAVAIPLIIGGLRTRRVLVRDRVSVTPSLHRDGARATLTFTF